MPTEVCSSLYKQKLHTIACMSYHCELKPGYAEKKKFLYALENERYGKGTYTISQILYETPLNGYKTNRHT